MKLEEKLSRMIQCETVSQAGVDNSAKFLAFHEVLRQLFPNVFAHCQVEKFGQALLVRWQGKTNHDQPIILMSHQDVVEASGKWSHEPFSGDIADGRVWGRGTVDTKGSLMCIFEALDELIGQGYEPGRDIYISSSDGEEVSGGPSRSAA